MALLGFYPEGEGPDLNDLCWVILNVETRDGSQFCLSFPAGDSYMWLEELPDNDMTPHQESRLFRVIRSDEPHP